MPGSNDVGSAGYLAYSRKIPEGSCASADHYMVVETLRALVDGFTVGNPTFVIIHEAGNMVLGGQPEAAPIRFPVRFSSTRTGATGPT